jgi:hypothetical protein
MRRLPDGKTRQVIGLICHFPIFSIPFIQWEISKISRTLIRFILHNNKKINFSHLDDFASQDHLSYTKTSAGETPFFGNQFFLTPPPVPLLEYYQDLIRY